MQVEHTLADEQDLHVKLVEHCWHVSPFCVKYPTWHDKIKLSKQVLAFGYD